MILGSGRDEDVRGGDGSAGLSFSQQKRSTVAISVMILVTGLVVMAVMAVMGDENRDKFILERLVSTYLQ